jgi:hypothetical protein
MLVRYVGSEPHPWLVADREYVVLALGSGDPHYSNIVMLHHPEDGGAFDWAWFPLDLFEITSADLPSNWVVHRHDDGSLDFLPAAWCRPGHWEDQDPSTTDPRPADVLAAATRRAWADYHSERDRILAEAGRPPGQHNLPGPSCAFRPPVGDGDGA